jgi:hypothetical protein
MMVTACSGEEVVAPARQFDLARLHPFSLDGCGDLAERAGRGSCDPLNLVFPGKSAREVQDSLMAVGWTDNGLGTVQAIVPFGSDVMVTQSVQLFKGDLSALDAPTSRFHVRLWDVPADTTVGAVHHESGFVIHAIDQDWELAEAEVREDLCARATCTTGPLLEEQSRLQDGDEEWRGRRNDARPSVILLP